MVVIYQGVTFSLLCLNIKESQLACGGYISSSHNLPVVVIYQGVTIRMWWLYIKESQLACGGYISRSHN